MNKNVFLVDLSKCLGFMTEAEREEALEYYKELFEEAGPENEQKVLAQLGSPTKVAVELHRSYDRSHADTTGAERLLRGNFAAGEADKPEESPEEVPSGEEVPLAEESPAAVVERILTAVEAAETAPAEESSAPEEAAPAVEEAAEEAAPPAEEKRFVEVEVPRAAPPMPEKPEPEAELPEEKRGMPGWAIALILVLTCWLWISVFAVLLSVAICIAAVPFSIGAAFIGAAAYLVICAIWALGMITDALLMFGAAAIVLALGIVLLWLGIWAAVKLIALLGRGTAATYRGVFGRPKKERAK